eukprot:9990224-Ditylum_brightwellii.AAC.2
MEDYHPIMGLWGDTMQYQFSSMCGMPALTLCANGVLDNYGFEPRASGAVDVVQLHKEMTMTSLSSKASNISESGSPGWYQDTENRLGVLVGIAVQSESGSPG